MVEGLGFRALCRGSSLLVGYYPTLLLGFRNDRILTGFFNFCLGGAFWVCAHPSMVQNYKDGIIGTLPIVGSGRVMF